MKHARDAYDELRYNGHDTARRGVGVVQRALDWVDHASDRLRHRTEPVARGWTDRASYLAERGSDWVHDHTDPMLAHGRTGLRIASRQVRRHPVATVLTAAAAGAVLVVVARALLGSRHPR